MSRADDILDLIDAGLQSSIEEGYGDDTGDGCVRCRRIFTMGPDAAADICAECRAFLLGDADTDPSEQAWMGNYAWRPRPGDMSIAPTVLDESHTWREAWLQSVLFGNVYVRVRPRSFVAERVRPRSFVAEVAHLQGITRFTTTEVARWFDVPAHLIDGRQHPTTWLRSYTTASTTPTPPAWHEQLLPERALAEVGDRPQLMPKPSATCSSAVRRAAARANVVDQIRERNRTWRLTDMITCA